MGKGGLTARVHQLMHEDAAAREILARGALSLRAMARWIIRAHEWTDATEDAVVSALRRYPVSRHGSVLPDARRALQRGHVNSRGSVCAFTIVKSPGVHRALGRVMDLVDPLRGDVFRFVEGERAITVIAGVTAMRNVRALLHADVIRDARTHLVQFDLMLADGAPRITGVLSVVSSTLAAHGIRVIEAATCGPELLILVHENDARRTFQVLVQLTTRDEASTRRG